MSSLKEKMYINKLLEKLSKCWNLIQLLMFNQQKSFSGHDIHGQNLGQAWFHYEVLAIQVSL